MTGAWARPPADISSCCFFNSHGGFDIVIKDEIPEDPEASQVQDDDALWVAKFNRSGDRWNNTRVEHAMLRLARECGIRTAESRIDTIGGRDVLLVKRFDRERVAEGYTRARMVSALTILRADEAATMRSRWSYLILVEELRRDRS